jgi:hypothetical protein
MRLTTSIAYLMSSLLLVACGSSESTPLAGGGSAGQAGAATGGESGAAAGGAANGGAASGGAANGGVANGGAANGGAANGGVANGGAANGGAATDCPETAPEDAASCTDPMLACSYTDVDCVCRGTWNCTDRSICPETQPARNTSCEGYLGENCIYESTTCTCREVNGIAQWTCGTWQQPAECPATMPTNGSDCTEAALTCRYSGTACTCDGTSWTCVGGSRP